MTVRRMTLGELQMVLGWARDEGWNPGLDDAGAFLAADPQGFFLSEVDGQPAAAISVVNHDPKHAFLGLYICLPEYRGQGIGLALWEKALGHAGDRSVTLDGVPEQQANYRKSGFVPTDRTVRWRGRVDHTGAGVRPAAASDLTRLTMLDEKAAGYRRHAFDAVWFRNTATRRTMILETGDAFAFATFRRCADGIKIGPFHASTRAQALALLQGCPIEADDGPLYIDVPASCEAMSDLVSSLAFEGVFETARMTRGVPPGSNIPRYFAVASLELG